MFSLFFVVNSIFVNCASDIPQSRFGKRYAELAARARVPLGFALLVVYAVFARPVLWRAVLGAAIALAGIALRALAAGCVDKNRALATGGPYAYTRNPLYLGTALVAAGFALAGGLWWMAALAAIFFAGVYLPVIGEEEAHLAKLFPEFRDYAARVPRLWPALRPRWEPPGRFSWVLYRRNQEYNALLGYLFGLALLVWKLLVR